MNRTILSFALLYLLTTPQGFAQGSSNSDQEKGISVIGECLTKVTQDRGAVTVGSSVLAKTSREASEQAIKAHELIKADVQKLGLKDQVIETANYSVNQECSYLQNKRVCEGFRAHLATRFETSEISRVGDVIAIAAKLGSEEVSNLETFASPEKLKSARESCLEIATKNAGTKAQKIAMGAGIKLGKLESITEAPDSDGPHFPQVSRTRQFEAAAMSEALVAAPSIDSRPLDLRVRITARYSIE